MNGEKKIYDNKLECCGCEMCVSVCPKGVIKMIQDREGFWYPSVINQNECINCKLCLKFCPVKNVENIKSEFIEAFGGWTNCKDSLTKSSSGGIASELSLRFAASGGIVYGAAYSRDYKCIEYIRADNSYEVERLRTSKYAQSQKKSVYQYMEKDLQEKKKVLFIGVPCDSAAVKIRFGQYNNLSIVSLICHGPTSPEVQRQFCEYLENKEHSKIESFSVRYKLNGQWKPYYVFASFKNHDIYCEKWDKTPYCDAFLHLKRPACNSCKFKVNHFAGDLLIGDLHSARKGMKAYNENGVSSMLVLTGKGIDLIRSIDDKITLWSVDMTLATHQVAINKSYTKKWDRKYFSFVFQKKGVFFASKLLSVRLEKMSSRIANKILVLVVKLKKTIVRK